MSLVSYVKIIICEEATVFAVFTKFIGKTFRLEQHVDIQR